jgi:hypothetical protein
MLAAVRTAWLHRHRPSIRASRCLPGSTSPILEARRIDSHHGARLEIAERGEKGMDQLQEVLELLASSAQNDNRKCEGCQILVRQLSSIVINAS